MKRFLKINAADNVAVALADLAAGEHLQIDGREVTLREAVARGHKFALRDLAEGENVIKYGYPIGHVTRPVAAGEWIHSHNLKTNLCDDLSYTYTPRVYPLAIPKRDDLRVQGYLRHNGQMGIRNELWIVPSVGCVNGQAQAIAERVRRECDCSHLDDVRVYAHNYGCSQLGDDHANTRRALARLVKHPNAGAVLVLGLGCGFRDLPRAGRENPRRPTPAVAAVVSEGGTEVRRFGRLFGYYGQSAGGAVLRLAGGAGRHDRADGGARNVRRRDHSDGPRHGPYGL